VENLTVVVPFYEGHEYLAALLDSIPATLPVIVVDDHSRNAPSVDGWANVKLVRPPEKGYFSGAVNYGIEQCRTDVLVLNQDVELQGTAWMDLLADARQDHFLVGERIRGEHPAFPYGYVHGVFMYMRREAIERVGLLNQDLYPLWGGTAEWQWRVCRANLGVMPLAEIPGLVHKRRGGFGSSIQHLLSRSSGQHDRLIRTPPEISVIIPCFNHGRYLAETLASLFGGMTSLGEMLPQTFQSFEVIIVDDGSTDGETPQIVDSLADGWKGVRVVHTPNRGTAAAHNTGVRMAAGKYLTFLSADDMREPWALEMLYRASLDNPHSMVYDEIRIFSHGQRGEVWRLPDYDFDRLIYKNMVPVGIMVERRAFQETGGYPESLKWGREDWGFAIALGQKGYCGVRVPRPGYLYRREGQNRTERNTSPEWMERFRSQMVELFPHLYRGRRPVGCCGGRRGGMTQSPPTAFSPRMNAMMATQAENMVLIEYMGRNVGSTQWGGPNLPSGRTYTFGANSRDVRKLVDKKDIEWFLSLRDRSGRNIFRRVSEALPSPEEEDPDIAITASDEKVTEDTLSAEDRGDFVDPALLTIQQVLALDLEPDQVKVVLELEKSGKARKTLIEALEQRLAR